MHRVGKLMTRVLISLTLLVFFATIASASVIYVKTSGKDSNSGSSWSQSKQTIQAAIKTAKNGDQVWVAKGTYISTITLKNGVALYGGFAGNESRFSQRKPSINATIIDGNMKGSVVTIPSGCGSKTVIDGFVIRRGSGTAIKRDIDADNYTIDRFGGGIYCKNSSPVISNNRITDNRVEIGKDSIYYWGAVAGGGIYCQQGSPKISGNYIGGNSCYKYGEGTGTGGGIYCSDCTVTLSDNEIVSNYSNEDGGGLFCINSNATISGNAVHANKTELAGAGINIANDGDCRVVISDNEIYDNQSEWPAGYGSSGSGGGIYAYGNDIEITDNDIHDNVSPYQGGGICIDGTDITITCNRVAGNSSYYFDEEYGDTPEGNGGGICVNGGAVLANNLIVNNRAVNGGGLYISSFWMPNVGASVINNTIVMNTTDGSGTGGGICIIECSPTVANNIVSACTSGIYCSTGTPSLRNNDVYSNGAFNYQGVSVGAGDISKNPLFVSATGSDYHLKKTSPCCNVGYDTMIQDGWVDYYGQPRIYGRHVDIGAAEWQQGR